MFLHFGLISFNLARALAVHHKESFVPVFCKVYIDYVFDNLQSGKRSSWFGKRSGKFLEFWIQTSVQTLYRVTLSKLTYLYE